MLARRSFLRFAGETVRVHAQHILGEEWFCTDRNGKGIVATCGVGSSPCPPDYLLMSLGACAGNGIKILLQDAGKTVRSLAVDVEADWTDKPQRRFGAIRLRVKCDGDITKEELQAITQRAENELCPIAGTLLDPPDLTATATLV
jgi:uncharacterized OsmC-like protein